MSFLISAYHRFGFINRESFIVSIRTVCCHGTNDTFLVNVNVRTRRQRIMCSRRLVNKSSEICRQTRRVRRHTCNRYFTCQYRHFRDQIRREYVRVDSIALLRQTTRTIYVINRLCSILFRRITNSTSKDNAMVPVFSCQGSNANCYRTDHNKSIRNVLTIPSNSRGIC